ncbi:MAG: hypothetical protein IJV19_05740 [Prevotella sp.]|nr:hypothetical protein [Prevotella sp.]
MAGLDIWLSDGTSFVDQITVRPACSKPLTGRETSRIEGCWHTVGKLVSYFACARCFFVSVGAVRCFSTHHGHNRQELTRGVSPLADKSHSGQHANVLSRLIPGSSWSLGNHPGWHVSSFGRRPMSVSVAAGSPVSPSDGI